MYVEYPLSISVILIFVVPTATPVIFPFESTVAIELSKLSYSVLPKTKSQVCILFNFVYDNLFLSIE